MKNASKEIIEEILAEVSNCQMLIILIHISPPWMFYNMFIVPWDCKENKKSYVLRGYSNGTLAQYGLGQSDVNFLTTTDNWIKNHIQLISLNVWYISLCSNLGVRRHDQQQPMINRSKSNTWSIYKKEKWRKIDPWNCCLRLICVSLHRLIF